MRPEKMEDFLKKLYEGGRWVTALEFKEDKHEYLYHRYDTTQKKVFVYVRDKVVSGQGT